MSQLNLRHKIIWRAPFEEAMERRRSRLGFELGLTLRGKVVRV